MSLRISIVALATMLALTTACTNKRVNNPLAKIDSKQPDKVLFDRGMDEMKHNHFEVARLDLQALISAYPDSEFIARAKLALADSWYAEGGSTAWAQAEQEYKDFITFFPNMPEAAEAQLKIANIHFSQMEKPDRDFTHAVRAEQEYRNVILQYPDNPKMVAEAKTKLLQVQEVIAEREYRVGRFYYMRGSYIPALARLQSLVNEYPLYSGADEALYLVGQSYEGQIATMHRMAGMERQQMEKLHKFNEAQLKKDEADRERLISHFTEEAAKAYSKILTRYPVMDRADSAKERLLALHQPVPRPTKAMLAQNKAEEDARRQESLVDSVKGAFGHRPDVSIATKVGEPALQAQEPVSPAIIVQEVNRVATGTKPAEHTLSGEIVGAGSVPGNQPAPHSDDPQSNAGGADPKATTQDDPNELKPTAEAGGTGTNTADNPDPNELKPNVAPEDKPQPAPAQVNEIAQGSQSGNGNTPAAENSGNSSGQELADDKMIASSKHKKKKGLGKIIPGK